MVDDQLDRDERVDPRRVATEPRQRVAHGGEVDDAGHAGEVLHEDALGRERDLVGGVAGALAVALGVGAPARRRRRCRRPRRGGRPRGAAGSRG